MSNTLPVNQETMRRGSRAARVWPFALMALGGVLLSLSFPNDLAPGIVGDRPPFALGWIALAPLWWGLLTLPPRAARWAVWLYGLAFYLGALSWMRLFGYLPWVLLAAALSLTPLLAILAAQRVVARPALVPLVFALAWAGLEWLRGQGRFGLSWAEVGMSQVDGPVALLAALGGVPLITFLMLWVTGASVQHALRKGVPPWMAPASLSVLALLLLAGWWQAEQARARWRMNTPRQRVAIVQPSTKIGLTPAALTTPSTPEERDRETRMLIAVSRRVVKPRADEDQEERRLPRLFIWSESALPDPPAFRPEIGRFCVETRSFLLAGGPHYRLEPGESVPRMANAAYLLDDAGAERDRYEKMHLVPFGEFVPFRSLVARYYTVRARDITPGAQRRLQDATGQPFGVGICFESTVSAISRAYAAQGARLLVFITNDAWFHRTSAVRQHFNHARFRALETGLPVARAASTGISGFIDPGGRILTEIGTYRIGAKSMRMPDGLPGTVYTAAGYLWGPLCLALALVLALLPALAPRFVRK